MLPSSHISIFDGFDVGNGFTVNTTAAVSVQLVVPSVTKAYTVALPVTYAPGVPIETLVAASVNQVTFPAPPLIAVFNVVKSKLA